MAEALLCSARTPSLPTPPPSSYSPPKSKKHEQQPSHLTPLPRSSRMTPPPRSSRSMDDKAPKANTKMDHDLWEFAKERARRVLISHQHDHDHEEHVTEHNTTTSQDTPRFLPATSSGLSHGGERVLPLFRVHDSDTSSITWAGDSASYTLSADLDTNLDGEQYDEDAQTALRCEKEYHGDDDSHKRCSSTAERQQVPFRRVGRLASSSQVERDARGPREQHPKQPDDNGGGNMFHRVAAPARSLSKRQVQQMKLSFYSKQARLQQGNNNRVVSSHSALPTPKSNYFMMSSTLPSSPQGQQKRLPAIQEVSTAGSSVTSLRSTFSASASSKDDSLSFALSLPTESSFSLLSAPSVQ